MAKQGSNIKRNEGTGPKKDDQSTIGIRSSQREPQAQPSQKQSKMKLNSKVVVKDK
jgi:hypothetical protein